MWLPEIHFSEINSPSEHKYLRARMTGVVIQAYVLQIKKARRFEIGPQTFHSDSSEYFFLICQNQGPGLTGFVFLIRPFNSFTADFIVSSEYPIDSALL